MKARCIQCKRMWNVSIFQSFPKTGYLCPACESRNRKQEREDRQCSMEK